MQIRSGLAKVVLGDLNRIEFDAITTADAALLAAGQRFQFSGESGQFYVIASVVSVSPPVQVDLTADYAGGVAVDTLTTYLIWTGFTPIRGLILPAPGDVDIRGAIAYNAQVSDSLLGGAGALTASGVATITAGLTTRTVTGTFPTPPYVVIATPNWLTATSVRPASKTTTEFVLDFSVPAPTGGGEINWGVV